MHKFPEEIIQEKEHFSLTLIGYNKDQWMVHTELVTDNDTVDELIENLFDKFPKIEYLHVRIMKACCYIWKITRA